MLQNCYHRMSQRQGAKCVNDLGYREQEGDVPLPGQRQSVELEA